jgi:hypothetical protein
MKLSPEQFELAVGKLAKNQIATPFALRITPDRTSQKRETNTNKKRAESAIRKLQGSLGALGREGKEGGEKDANGSGGSREGVLKLVADIVKGSSEAQIWSLCGQELQDRVVHAIVFFSFSFSFLFFITHTHTHTHTHTDSKGCWRLSRLTSFTLVHHQNGLTHLFSEVESQKVQSGEEIAIPG